MTSMKELSLLLRCTFPGEGSLAVVVLLKSVLCVNLKVIRPYLARFTTLEQQNKGALTASTRKCNFAPAHETFSTKKDLYLS